MPPKSHKHHLAGANGAVAGLVVRAGRVLAGRHDREVHSVVTLGQDAPSQFGGHVRLGATDERNGTGLQCGGDAIDGRSRGTQRVHLVRVLHRAQRTDHVARVPELGRRHPSQQVDDELAPRAIADGGHARRARELGNERDGVLGLVPGRDAELVGPFDDARRLETGHDERGVAVDRKHQHREPFERHGLVPDQPRQVGTDREQQHVDVLTGHRGAHPVHPLLVHGAQANPGSSDLI